MSINEKRNVWMDWQVKEKDSNGEVISEIIGQTDKYIVYYVGQSWLKWDYDATKVYKPHVVEYNATKY